MVEVWVCAVEQTGSCGKVCFGTDQSAGIGKKLRSLCLVVGVQVLCLGMSRGENGFVRKGLCFSTDQSAEIGKKLRSLCLVVGAQKRLYV